MSIADLEKEPIRATRAAAAPKAIAQPPLPPLLRVDGVSKTYGDVLALDGVGLDIRAGEIVGLVGPNGAGKTTLLECIQGLLEFHTGSIDMLGRPVRGALVDAVKQRIGVAPQFFSLPPSLKVGEIARMYHSLYERAVAPESVLAGVDLTEHAGIRFGRLSGGQKRRLSLALALMGDPELLFLDEPTGDLDPQSRRFIWDQILDSTAQSRRGVLIATHQMDEVEALCGRVILLDGGRVREADTPQALIARHCPGHHVRFVTSAEQAAVLSRTLAEVKVEPDASRPGRCSVSFRTPDLASSLPGLLALGGEANAIEDLLVSKHTLEDVFLKLTGRALRD